MDSDFDALMKLFSLSVKEKEEKVKEIFERTNRFFAHYKEVQQLGNEKDKERAQKKMDLLTAAIQKETAKGDGIQKIMNIKGLIPKEQREMIDQMKEETRALEEEKAKLAEEGKQKRREALQAMKKKKASTKKSGWIKS